MGGGKENERGEHRVSERARRPAVRTSIQMRQDWQAGRGEWRRRRAEEEADEEKRGSDLTQRTAQRERAGDVDVLCPRHGGETSALGTVGPRI